MNWFARQLRQKLKEKFNKLKSELTEKDHILTEWENRYQQLELYSDREIKRLSSENKELTAYQGDLQQEIRALKLDKAELLRLNNSWQNQLKEDMNEEEIIKEKEKTLGIYDIKKNELYLDVKLDGNIDLSQFYGKCRKVVINVWSEATNLTFSNYNLPFTIANFSEKGLLNIDLNWIFNNKDVVVLFFPKWGINFIEKKESNKFAQKLLWHLISGRGRKILRLKTTIEKLIDISDLDEIIESFDYNRWEDKEYQQELFGGKYKFPNIYTAFDNLSNRILARNLIVMSRLMDGTNETYEKAMNDLALGHQKCPGMIYKGHDEEKIVETINKALSGDKELLARIADLPYISQWVKDQLATKE